MNINSINYLEFVMDFEIANCQLLFANCLLPTMPTAPCQPPPANYANCLLPTANLLSG
jgi:hypothetical protein